MQEIWEDVKGYEGIYIVRNVGNNRADNLKWKDTK